MTKRIKNRKVTLKLKAMYKLRYTSINKNKLNTINILLKIISISRVKNLILISVIKKLTVDLF